MLFVIGRVSPWLRGPRLARPSLQIHLSTARATSPLLCDASVGFECLGAPLADGPRQTADQMNSSRSYNNSY